MSLPVRSLPIRTYPPEASFMRRHTLSSHLLTLLSLTLTAVPVGAQFHPPIMPVEPLMFVRFAGPAGMKVTFYRPETGEQTFTTPFVVGFRPGYIYRMRMNHFPGYPEVFSIYPSLEVRAVLQLPPGQRGVNFPAPMVLSDDLDRILAGAVVTRVISLEDPEKAIPVATTPDRPLEFQVLPGRDPIQESHEHGRPFLVFRMGQREFDPREIAEQTVPGTIFLPGDKNLPPPACPPYLTWGCLPLFDPLLGPRTTHEIFVKDGGDIGLRAGYGPDGKLVGLDPTDTVAQYFDNCGRPRVAVSNRVCLLVPRFIHTRGEIAPAGQVALTSPLGTSIVMAQNTILTQVPPLLSQQNVQLGGVLTREQLTMASNRYGSQVVGRVEGSRTYITAQETSSVSAACKPEPCEPPLPLKLIKWPDLCAAQIGEVITFHLKYINDGGQPINEVIVSDSLSPRLEYISGSAKSDRSMTFTTQPNGAGSQTLRWQLNGPLPPRQYGIVSFQVRIR
jgi:uncharacterized repeat protein (TIGR01451 family)